MSSEITAIAERYFEMVDLVSITMLADPLDKDHYQSVAIGMRDRAFGFVREVIRHDPHDENDEWLRIRMLVLLPSSIQDLPNDVRAFRDTALNEFVARQQARIADMYQVNFDAAIRSNDGSADVQSKHAVYELIAMKSRLGVALSARDCGSTEPLTYRLLDVVNEVERLLDEASI